MTATLLRKTPVAATLLGLALVITGCPNGNGNDNAGNSGIPAVETAVAGGSHTLAVGADGSLWAWGNNAFGQLGNGVPGTANNRRIPTRIGAAGNWTAVSAAGSHTLAIGTDGSLWAWGLNAWGELGIPGGNRSIPTRVGADTGWASVAAGINFSAAVGAGGTLWTWGSNSNGQLGDGGSTPRNTPARIGTDAGAGWVSVSAGMWHGVALGTDGSLWAWGANLWGQVGEGDGVESLRNPVTRIRTEGTATWVAVSAGSSHNVAICSEGFLWAWGDNRQGQLGLGHSTATGIPARIETDYGITWVSATAGDNFAMAVSRDGRLWGWGVNRHGQLGPAANVPTPAQIGDATNWVYVSAGVGHTVAVREDGSVWAWGENFSGQLGDGTSDMRNAPVRVR